jgi:hypothetical protein
MWNLRRYLDYVSAFNGQDWNGVAKEFFSVAIRAEFPFGVLTGRDELLSWFEKAHESIHETLVPIMVDIQENGSLVMANLKVNFVLLGPTDYSPVGEGGRAGDTVELPMRARYGIGKTGLVESVRVSFTGAPLMGRIC